MWNETEMIGDVEGASASLEQQQQLSLDESAYSIFFGLFNPDSPIYSNNMTDLGIGIGTLKFCVEGVALTLLAVMGLIGNIVSIIVLSNPKMKNPSNCFLLCLAMCDICTLTGSIVLIGIPSLLTYYPSEEGMFTFNSRIVNYGNALPAPGLLAISITTFSASIYLTMALTLERYLAICRPIFARHLCTWSRAKIFSAIVISISILYNLPRWSEFTYIIETTNNFTTYRPVPTPLKMHPIYDTYYTHVSYVVLMFFLPVGFLVVFNIRIYREIKQANKLRKNLSPSQKHENSLTRVLFGVVAVFLTCNIFPAVHILFRYFVGNREYVPEAECLWVFMLSLNSSVNFIIYCISGSKFREVFCEMICFWRKRELKDLQGSDARKSRTLSNSSQSRISRPSTKSLTTVFILNTENETTTLPSALPLPSPSEPDAEV